MLKMIGDGMKKKYYLFEMDIVWLQIISAVLLVLMFFVTLYVYPEFNILDKSFAIAFILMIPYMILHEILHSISYVMNGAKFKNITYGVHLDKGVLCCLCKQNITKKNILISLLTPFIIIGVLTYIIGILINSQVLVILSIFNISGCAGDLMMFLELAKIKNFEFSEYDNPVAFGLYSSEDLSKTKLKGLKYIDCSTKLDKKNLKKIRVSMSSIFIALGYLLLGAICYIM